MVILFLLGALQGLVGWIMVMSGLNEENIYVSHYRLAIHFILALGLACYAFWFALDLMVSAEQKVFAPSLKKFTGWLIAVLGLQLIYGAFMAGLKAAVYAPTWPDINGSFWPQGGRPSGYSQIFDNPITVQFIHRNLAYLVVILLLVWTLRSGKNNPTSLFRKTNWLPFTLVIVQVVLGILTVLNSPRSNSLLWLGVSHQFVGMLLLLSLVFSFYLLSSNKKLIRV
jgi:cytochrome c oxidase assembly protein subunit 15